MSVLARPGDVPSQRVLPALPALTAVQTPGATATLHVDLDAVCANTALLAARAGGRLMAVVKSDGYGHGAADVARTALASGATSLGVTSLAEAVRLRDAGIGAPVLSWLNPVDADWEEALRLRIDVAVPSPEHLEAVTRAAARAGRAARVHLHVDTGMSRDGASRAIWPRLFLSARAAQARGLVRVVGVMSHLGCARAGDPCTQDARRAFNRALALARHSGLRPHTRHLAATAATLVDPRTHYDLCRVGAGLVGIDPSLDADAAPGATPLLQPAMTLSAPVVGVRWVGAGTRVGYGHGSTTSASTHLALLPVGYADGVPRGAAGAQVLLGGRRCPVVGLVSMDQLVVDVGAAPVRVGEVATVFGPGRRGEPTAAQWARWAGTIEQEVVTGIGSRPTRTSSGGAPR